MKWKQKNNANSLAENVLIVYFKELQEKLKPSTLWSIWSMLKKTLSTKENVAIDKYINLKSFLKNNSKGYTPKKSLTLSWDNIQQFMSTAPDELYLAAKIILIFGICGALRSEEITNIRVQDVENLGNKFLVSIHHNKNEYPRTFVIGPLYYDKVKEYILLRPSEEFSDRFFVQYSKGKCTRQVIGRNKIGETPQIIATYLQLDNPKKYTGHCLRRTSATLLSNSGANMTMIKQLGGWRSDNVAQGYIENSMLNREKIFEGITHENRSTPFNNQCNKTLKEKVNSSAVSDVNKENNNSNLMISWEDFEENFDEGHLNQEEVHHIDKKKAFEPTVKQLVPVNTTTKEKSNILVSTVNQPATNTVTKQHFSSKPPVAISFQKNNVKASNTNNQKETNMRCPNCSGNSNIKYENCTITNNYYYYKSDV